MSGIDKEKSRKREIITHWRDFILTFMFVLDSTL